MPTFSATSKDRLATCDGRIQRVMNAVVERFDCSILVGHRSDVEQEDAYRTGRSKVQYPNSKHNKRPSLAVDVAPYPIDWNDRERLHLFAGYVLATARSIGVELRWGGDWDRDTEVRDNTFDDLVHFEVVE